MLLEKLNNLCRYFDDEFDVNCGGCCFLAFAISTQLYKYNIPYKLVVLGDHAIRPLTLRNRVKNDEGDCYPLRSFTANHYLLRVGDEYINLGDFCIKHYNKSETSYIEPMDIYNMYKNGCWNPDYDRFYNLSIYKELVKFFKTNEEEAKNFASRKL